MDVVIFVNYYFRNTEKGIKGENERELRRQETFSRNKSYTNVHRYWKTKIIRFISSATIMRQQCEKIEIAGEG